MVISSSDASIYVIYGRLVTCSNSCPFSAAFLPLAYATERDVSEFLVSGSAPRAFPKSFAKLKPQILKMATQPDYHHRNKTSLGSFIHSLAT